MLKALYLRICFSALIKNRMMLNNSTFLTCDVTSIQEVKSSLSKKTTIFRSNSIFIVFLSWGLFLLSSEKIVKYFALREL